MPLSKEEGCTEYIVPQVLHISRAPKALALGTRVFVFKSGKI